MVDVGGPIVRLDSDGFVVAASHWFGETQRHVVHSCVEIKTSLCLILVLPCGRRKS